MQINFKADLMGSCAEMRAPCVRVVRAALLRKYAPVLFAVRLRRSRSAEDKKR